MDIETPDARAAIAEKVLTLVDNFIAAQGIGCAEDVWQTDHVIENAYEFIASLCDVAGYAETSGD